VYPQRGQHRRLLGIRLLKQFTVIQTLQNLLARNMQRPMDLQFLWLHQVHFEYSTLAPRVVSITQKAKIRLSILHTNVEIPALLRPTVHTNALLDALIMVVMVVVVVGTLKLSTTTITMVQPHHLQLFHNTGLQQCRQKSYQKSNRCVLKALIQSRFLMLFDRTTPTAIWFHVIS
jgi:hypothetical protein